jgi:Rps23 Pro-64 3,4-dihydroxylase Tpa1-like proline 4-hydroxylase
MIAAAEVDARIEPFPHTTAASFLHVDDADALLHWLEREAPWKLRVEDFYEQHECALSSETLPDNLQALISPNAVQSYAAEMFGSIGAGRLTLISATAHRLSGGQSIRIHNDYLEGEETHRLIVQLNRGWADENGGFLMLFSSADASDVARVLRPVHRSAIAFEISPRSFHAVSPTTRGQRYTLVFSYRRAA